MGWVLRCLGLVILSGTIFVGLQDGGLFEAAMSRPDVAAVSAPPDPQQNRDDDALLEEIVESGAHGHFVTDVYVNGTPITFLIDTGASHVILNAEAADRLGLNVGNRRHDTKFQSANGSVYATPVVLRDVRFGQFQLYDLEAFVNREPLDISLLGMSFLRRFESYEVNQGRLILRW